MLQRDTFRSDFAALLVTITRHLGIILTSRALYSSHMWSQICLLHEDIQMSPEAPAAGALCHVGVICFNIVIAIYFRKVMPWHLSLNEQISPFQHQRATFRGTWVSVEEDKMIRNVLSGRNKMRT